MAMCCKAKIEIGLMFGFRLELKARIDQAFENFLNRLRMYVEIMVDIIEKA